MDTPVVLVYHKNLERYPKPWIDKFVESVETQTYKNFDILEIDFGATQNRLFTRPDMRVTFYNGLFDNFVQALNFLIKEARVMNYRYLINTNVDDWYCPTRIEKQLPYLKHGFDIVSCNFSLVKDDKEYHYHKFHNLDIQKELDRNNNIIAHPAVCYNISFFNDYQYIPGEIPREDLLLWKRSIKTKKFFIHQDNLLFHRVYHGSISAK